MNKTTLFAFLFYLIAGIPHLKAGESMPLKGTWEFCLDAKDQGIPENWTNKKLSDTITLPGITDETGQGEPEHELKVLSRKHKYIGAAWYSKEINIPEEWKNKTIELNMERVMWLSKVWLDGKPMGEQNSLCTPHHYILGKLSPGKHRLTLLIDNREQAPLLGASWGHSTGNQTQIQWNGVLGDFELRALENVRVDKVRTFTDHKGKLDMETGMTNEGDTPKKANLNIELKEKKSGKSIFKKSYPVTVAPGFSLTTINEQIPNVKPWDEFSPFLYDFHAKLAIDENPSVVSKVQHTLGFRSLKTEGDHIVLNDIPRYMRGNLDCAVFPLTGYPPTDKKSWLNILKHYRENGLNHVRFHSWTPPQAAFEAADELGLYVLSEIFWRDGWMGQGLDIEKAEPFLRPELKRIADTHGNHPSLLMLAMGNELGGFDIKRMDPWIAEVKKHDPRHLYATSVRRRASIHADVDFQGNLGSGYPVSYLQKGELNTRRDFRPWYGKENWYLKDQAHLPGIQHEIGQWVFYPDWNEVDKYSGLLKADGLIKAKELAKENGLLPQNKELCQSSGKTAMMLYKENIESFLRTPHAGGFQLLGMQDFPGQGIALIGWLDSFYNSKGIITPEEVRQYCNTTVPLMSADKYVFQTTEPLVADLQVFHFEKKDIPASTLSWTLSSTDKKVIASGEFPHLVIKNAQLSPAGQISVDLSSIAKPTQLTLSVSLKGTKFKNHWNFWAFPPGKKEASPEGVFVTDSLNEASKALQEKKKVLLLAHKLGEQNNTYYAQWLPAFWVGNATATNGTLVQNTHPALKEFPTEDFANFQWYELCQNSRGYEMEGLPLDFRPIVQPINDFHFNKKLASVFELKSPEGASLLVCGYDIDSDLENRPVASAFRKSLLTYMNSPQFDPKTAFEKGWLERAIIAPNAPVTAPEKYNDAFLYIKAGGNRNLPVGTHQKWSEKMDAVTPYDAAKYGYEVTCDLVWKRTSEYSLWQGKKMHIDFKLPFDFTGFIALTFDSYDNENRTGNILHNGKTVEIGKLPAPKAGGGGGYKTIYLPLKAGDTLLGKYGLDITCTGGANLLITDVAIIPEIPKEDK